jgi:1-acyl-sn-glycerol-3-phosphate acyltransferase
MDSRFPLRLARLFLLVIWTALILPPVQAGRLALAFDAGLKAKFSAKGCMVWARAVCAILGIDVGSTGHRVQNTGFTVCNHVSYIDILVMASISPSVFVSKMEVRSWPVIGWLARLGGTVFIDRRSALASWRSLSDLETALSHGVNVVTFPEGTTTNGSMTGEFKRMLFEAPARAGIAVIPVSIRYYSADKSAEIPWYGEMTLLPHLWSLLGIRRIKSFLYFSRAITFDARMGKKSVSRNYLSAKSRESVMSGLYSLDRWFAY